MYSGYYSLTDGATLWALVETFAARVEPCQRSRLRPTHSGPGERNQADVDTNARTPADRIGIYQDSRRNAAVADCYVPSILILCSLSKGQVLMMLPAFF